MTRFLLVFLSSAVLAQATEYTWIGGGEKTRWDLAANWSPGTGTPGEDDKAVLTSAKAPSTLVDLRAAFMACMANESVVVRPGGAWTSNGKLLTHDGVHANSRGDRLIAEQIARGISEALGGHR